MKGLHVLQRSGKLEREFSTAQYWVPFTDRCKACGRLVECDTQEHGAMCVGPGGVCEEGTMLKASCHYCTFRMPDGKEFRLTAPRDYLCVTNQV